jgi:hypothetical protein
VSRRFPAGEGTSFLIHGSAGASPSHPVEKVGRGPPGLVIGPGHVEPGGPDATCLSVATSPSAGRASSIPEPAIPPAERARWKTGPRHLRRGSRHIVRQRRHRLRGSRQTLRRARHFDSRPRQPLRGCRQMPGDRRHSLRRVRHLETWSPPDRPPVPPHPPPTPPDASRVSPDAPPTPPLRHQTGLFTLKIAPNCLLIEPLSKIPLFIPSQNR